MEENFFEKKPLINEKNLNNVSFEKENPFIKKEIDFNTGLIKKIKEVEKKKEILLKNRK